jgi:DNA topoisomerase IA
LFLCDRESDLELLQKEGVGAEIHFWLQLITVEINLEKDPNKKENHDTAHLAIHPTPKMP